MKSRVFSMLGGGGRVEIAVIVVVLGLGFIYLFRLVFCCTRTSDWKVLDGKPQFLREGNVVDVAKFGN